ncbi:MAG: hypothetical protein M0R30_03275 [Methanoregula sp.]|jgi:hypothetical protein|uniref:hypothetical protein n=1 Tax=Methanoregula sp. TaxID=2052170 RepID=UPI002600FE9B|nr:hypothetical protein [Methanoregula sp.]MCK9630643.1 hypothetical protein [Methanoregula sp.]
MGTITLTIENSTEEKFREIVKKKLGTRKGSLGEATTQALEFWMHHETQEEIARDALALLDTGYNFGKRRYSERKDLYDR